MYTRRNLIYASEWFFRRGVFSSREREETNAFC